MVLFCDFCHNVVMKGSPVTNKDCTNDFVCVIKYSLSILLMNFVGHTGSQCM